MVSCIITTYNRPTDILKRAMESVLSQTFRDIELIVVNDYPENVSLAKKIQSLVVAYKENNEIPVRYIEHERNRGACAARNTGVNAAHGEFIAFLDDDDQWMPEKIQKMIVYLLDDQNAGLVYSRYIIRSDRNDMEIRPAVFYEGWFTHLLGQNYIGSTSFPLMRKASLIAAGMFDTEMKSMQDWDMWLRITQIADVAYCDMPLTIYYVEAESITTNIEKKISGHNRMIEKYKSDYEKNRKEYSIRLDNAGYDLYKYGACREGMKYLLSGIKKYPFQLEHLKIIKRMINRKRHEMREKRSK